MFRFVFLLAASGVLNAASARAELPLIESGPADTTVCAGDLLELSVAAVNATAFQWLRDDAPIPGATQATLSIAAAALSDEGDYTVVVSNADGALTSEAAQVRVRAIVTQPEPFDACDPNEITLSVTVSGATGAEGVDTIGSAASSASGARLRGVYYRATRDTTLTRIESYLNTTVGAAIIYYVYESETLDGDYTLRAQSNLNSSVAGVAWRASGPLAVPIISGRYYIIGAGWSSDSVTYYYGSTHPISTRFGPSVRGFASAWRNPLPTVAPRNTSSLVFRQRLTTSDEALSYEWRRDGVLLSEASDTLRIADPSPADSGIYEVTIRSGACALMSEPIPVSVGIVPQLSGPIQRIGGACRGEMMKLIAPTIGSDLRYEWRRDGAVVGVESEYIVEEVSSADRGKYALRIANACGEALAPELEVEIGDGPPRFATQPQDILECAGKRAVLIATARDDDVTYQWRRNGVDISGATGDTLDLSPLEAAAAGDYDVTLRNECGFVTSRTAVVAVAPAPVFSDTPEDVWVCPGVTVELTAATTDADTVQWYRDGRPLPDETGFTLRIDAVDANDIGEYVAKARGECGQIVSAPARIDLAQPIISAAPEDVYVAAGDSFSLQVTASTLRRERDTIGDGGQMFNGPRMRGNLYEVERDAVLRGIEQELAITDAGPLRFFVYERSESTGPFALIVDVTVTPEPLGRGFYGPTGLDLPLRAGRAYIIGAAWAGSHNYYAGGAHPQSTWFGHSVAGFAASYGSTLPITPTATQSLVWSQRLTTEDESLRYQWLRDGSPLSGATHATYAVSAAAAGDAGDYEVQVSSSCGATARATARVRVSDPLGAPTEPKGPRRERRDR